MAEYSLCISGVRDIAVTDIIQIEDTKSILRDFDKLTGTFENEQGLKHYLSGTLKLLHFSDFRRNLRILYKRKNKQSFLPIVYKDCAKFLNVEYLKNIFYIFKQDKNFRFFQELINYYEKISSGNLGWKSQQLNINKLHFCLKELEQGNGFSCDLEIKQLFDEILDDFLKRAIYTKNSRGNLIEDYNGIRILGIFVYNFCEKQRKIKERIEEISRNIKDLKELKEEFLDDKKDSEEEKYVQLTFKDI